MRRMRFSARTESGPRGAVVVAVPFDPDKTWVPKAFHPISGTVNGRFFRGKLERAGDRWVITASAMWARESRVSTGMRIIMDIAPEGAQRSELAPDIAAALDDHPNAAAFFDTLAQFYTKAYLRWIDATARRPEARAERIAEVVRLLEAGIKQRPTARRGQPDNPD